MKPKPRQKASKKPPNSLAIAKTKASAGLPSDPPKKTRQKPAQAFGSRQDWWDERRQALMVALVFPPVLALEVPLVVKSEANERGHWARRWARSSGQHRAVHLTLASFSGRQTLLALRKRLADGDTIVVGMTVRRPRTYDDDGLVAACKAPRDALAKALGIDDGDKRLVFLPVAHEKLAGSSVLIEAWVKNASRIAAPTTDAPGNGLGRAPMVEADPDPTPPIDVPRLRPTPNDRPRPACPEVDDA